MQTEYIPIYGNHAVREALLARPEAVKVVYFAETYAQEEIKELAHKHSIPERKLSGKTMPKEVPSDAVHQGVVAEIDAATLMQSFPEFLSNLNVENGTGLVILGEIHDPHNVGAIIRSAAAFGVSGVLIPVHRQAQVTGAVFKVSVGAAFRVPLVSVTNVNHAIAELKNAGFWIYGLDGEGTQPLNTERFTKPSAFVLGNEATGIRTKTLEHCDISLRIPITRSTESLNASTAAAVTLYAWTVQK